MDQGAVGKSSYHKEPGHTVLLSRKCYQDKGAEENKNNGGGGGRRDNRSQDRRDGYNKSGHDAFKKKEKVRAYYEGVMCNNNVSRVAANLQRFQHHRGRV